MRRFIRMAIAAALTGALLWLSAPAYPASAPDDVGRDPQTGGCHVTEHTSC